VPQGYSQERRRLAVPDADQEAQQQLGTCTAPNTCALKQAG